MKVGRAVWQNQIYFAVVEEQAQQAVLIGQAIAKDANPVLAWIEQGVAITPAQLSLGKRVPLKEVRFLSPLSALVRNVIAIGKNYYDHALEFDKSGFNATGGASAIPEYPQVFTKATTSLVGPDDAIRFDPATTTSIDYEGEIGVVIGKRSRNVSKANWQDAVYGFIALNDVTARDLQKNHAQWFLGKSLDTFCPLGPWIATRDEVSLDSLSIKTWVNGELRQDAPISQLIFDIPTLIETLTRTMTLLPGDIIATGTPVGVGIGFTPPKFLRNGDIVRIAATGLGELNNPVETFTAKA